MKTSIRTDLSNEDYHSLLAIGSSGLKLLQRSPAHYWAQYVNPDRSRKEPTPAMKLGTAVHCAILEQGEFDNRYITVPEGIDKRTKDGKALFAEIEASGKEPLTPDNRQLILSMASAALALPVSIHLFSLEHYTEHSMFWTDPDTGADCKIRPDFHVPPCPQFPNGIIMDVKTCQDASPIEFSRNAWNSDMHLQAALYCDGFKRVYKTDGYPMFLWLAVEKESPFACKYYSAQADLLAYGLKELRPLLALFAECVRTGQWPAYDGNITPLELPTWAAKTVADALAANEN